jgi:hypothetical protein
LARFKGALQKAEERLDPSGVTVFLNQFLYAGRLGYYAFDSLSARAKVKTPRNLNYFARFEHVLISFPDFTNLYQHMQELLMEGSEGTLPLAKLNCFKAYMMCLEVWADISKRYCTTALRMRVEFPRSSGGLHWCIILCIWAT